MVASGSLDSRLCAAASSSSSLPHNTVSLGGTLSCRLHGAWPRTWRPPTVSFNCTADQPSAPVACTATVLPPPQIAVDIAKGLVFLHSKRIIHFDLKSPNILLARDGTAKIGDVGLARIMQVRSLFCQHSPSVLLPLQCRHCIGRPFGALAIFIEIRSYILLLHDCIDLLDCIYVAVDTGLRF